MSGGFAGGGDSQYGAPMESLIAGVLGAVVGSFLNVCIRRIPRDESIVLPASHCPHCGQPIRPYDNFPILSFLWLRGRCRACAAPISWRYPIVEALTALLFVALEWEFGLNLAWAIQAAFVAALIVVTFIDLEHQIIPDVISLPGILIGLSLSLAGLGPHWTDSLAGVLLGGGFLWGIAAGYYALAGREGMGGGDIKLLAMIGAFQGWASVLLVLLLSSTLGSLIGGVVLLGRGDAREPIPFGPFLVGGALVSMFWGDTIIGWYLGRLGL